MKSVLTGLTTSILVAMPYQWIPIGILIKLTHLPLLDLGPLKRGVRDSRFKPLNGPEIQDSNFKQARIQDSNFIWAVSVYSHQVGIQISKWVFRIHYTFEGGIQDSNLNPRKMAGIQDSNLVFKGPRSSCHSALWIPCTKICHYYHALVQF